MARETHNKHHRNLETRLFEADDLIIILMDALETMALEIDADTSQIEELVDKYFSKWGTTDDRLIQ